jgi:hyperosmotically inducible periplasmic protein
MKRVPAILLILALVAPLGAIACGATGAASPQRSAAAAPTDDPTITARVKTVLINDRTISSTIDVQTNQGVVTLSGKVKSKDEETKAIELARSVRGVTDVKSKLEIQP